MRKVTIVSTALAVVTTVCAGLLIKEKLYTDQLEDDLAASQFRELEARADARANREFALYSYDQATECKLKLMKAPVRAK